MRRIIFFALSFLLIGGELFFASAKNIETTWKAGISKAIITPRENMWMAGYGARTKPSEGKLHDLWAKALYLEDAEGEDAVLITTDILGFPRAISDQICNRLGDELGLSRSQIILNSSHTHSGPVLSDALTSIYPLDDIQRQLIEDYSEWFSNEIVELAHKAKRSVKPANIYAGNGVVRFQVNRRNNPAARLEESTELKGPIDHAVPVLKIENRRGKTEAIVFGYACHPTVLNIYQWSGDYAGFARLELEKSYKRATALFFQGAGADLNPLPRRSVHLAQQYGKELAAAVDRVLKEDMQQLEPSLKTVYSEVSLELNAPPEKSELKEMIDKLKGTRKRWAETLLANLERNEPVMSAYPYPVQLWQLGDQIIASLGGEPVVNYSNNLKKILGNNAFVMGYSNDVMAYIPTEQILSEGGYEGESAQMVYGMPAVWKTGIEKNILRHTAELAESAGIPVNREATGQLYDSLDGKDANMQQSTLIANRYFSGFDFAHDTYNALSAASDGKIYYVLSSQLLETGGQVCVYDPETDETTHLGDLTEICGEKGLNAISQGKSHVRFYEAGGKLYFSTHVGYYEMIDGMECLPVNAPRGYKLYPGGHFLSYDLSTGKFEDLGLAPEGEGVLTMVMDEDRMQIYAITWPMGYFVHLDLNNGKLKNLGLVSEKGEGGKVGEDYRVLCRSMFVDHRDGRVYYSTAEGEICYYDPAHGTITLMEDVNLRLDYFGKYDYTRPGSMSYNWRQILWYPEEQAAYGVHGNSGYLFRFDPKESQIEIVRRITSIPSQKSGMFDYFSYGYLGFDLGPDGETLYYLTGGPIYIDGKRVEGVKEIAMGAARGLENLHLITYHIPTATYTDHGPVFYEDGAIPIYVNSIAVGKDGSVYTLARFIHEGKEIQDLIKIPDPFEGE
jgi:hypothetical protein